MQVLCLDLEGVLIPEIWIAVAEEIGQHELSLTTRDIADYDELMQHRMRVLTENNIGLADIRSVVDSMSPLPGAKSFLDWARCRAQVVILSDTFYEFANPLMVKLGHPTLFCHSLKVSDNRIVGYNIRQENPKTRAVEALQSLNFEVLAAGDSYNDIGMLRQADRGFFFNAPESIVHEFPEIVVTSTYEELKNALAFED